MDQYKSNNYRELLVYYFSENKGKRGFLSRIAEVTNCQLSYISQVFSEKRNLNLEQASKVAKHLSFDKDLEDFFYDLILYERAGTANLKKFYADKIQQRKNEKLTVSSKLASHDSLEEKYQEQYYSHWSYSAIHIIVTMEKYQNINTISAKLSLDKNYVEKILEDLVSWGLIKKEISGYKISTKSIHLKSSSPYLRNHHQNWRLRSIQKIFEDRSGLNLHFSSVTAISALTREVIQAGFLNQVSDIKRQIRASENEDTLMGINIDFYEI